MYQGNVRPRTERHSAPDDAMKAAVRDRYEDVSDVL